MAVWAHAKQANRGQSIARTYRSRHHIVGLSPRRPCEQRPKQRPHLSCPPTQRLAESTPTDGADARAAPSLDGPATTVAVSDQQHSSWLIPHRQSDQRPEQRPCRARHQGRWLSHAYKANTVQIRAIIWRPRHPSCWLSLRLPIEQRPEQRPQLLCPQPSGWLSPHRPGEQRPEQRPHLSCPPPQLLAEPTRT
jgi:hypothetical protein